MKTFNVKLDTQNNQIFNHDLQKSNIFFDTFLLYAIAALIKLLQYFEAEIIKISKARLDRKMVECILPISYLKCLIYGLMVEQ